MSDAKRKLLGLFRSRSTAGERPSRDSQRDREHRRRRERPATSHSPPRRRSGRENDTLSPHAKSEPRRFARQQSTTPSPPPEAPAPIALTEWPPPGVARDGSLTQGKAMELIASGVPVFKGFKRSIPHASEEYYNLYASCEGVSHVGNDGVEEWSSVFSACSFRLQDSEPAAHPWETLEQPSMAFCYGTRPGTNTLNHWVTLSGNPIPIIELRDPGVKPREVELSTILERLIYLENDFEERNEDLMYKNLYKNLLRDPDKYTSPHKAMEKQIADLIIVLSRKDWIDFSRPENQVVAKFFANATYTDHGRYKLFFHQLLLSMELDYRIHSKRHSDWAKEKLLAQLPPCIAWNLALARKWRHCVSIEKFKTGGDPETTLRKFARVMKWPNLPKVDEVLRERNPDEKPLEDRSSDTMSYFTGMILPGITLPWLVMNSLIDCDADAEATNALAALTHMHPNCGFQFRGTTYWSATSIVGKVLAPTCKEIAGWIGPARPAPDLSRVEIARIRQRRPKQYLAVSDVESMIERSDPLGPPSSSYPVSEYQLVIPDLEPETIVDNIRIEKLALKPLALPLGQDRKMKDEPLTYDAAVQFAIDGQSWPLRLSYDVSFITAYPCARGPHPLFFDYSYQAVKINEILTIRDWGGLNNGMGSVGPPSTAGGARSASGSGKLGEGPAENGKDDDDELDKVLVIEAFGVRDNEVLARAWCSHWGLGAVVADIERTCMACAIREAYAACLNVVILIEGGRSDNDEP